MSKAVLDTTHFRAWVPTITGRLSFSSIGKTRIPGRLYSTSTIVDGAQYPRAKQELYWVVHERNLSDGLIGGRLQRLLGGGDTKFFFACSARTAATTDEARGKVVGRIYFGLWDDLSATDIERLKNTHADLVSRNSVHLHTNGAKSSRSGDDAGPETVGDRSEEPFPFNSPHCYDLDDPAQAALSATERCLSGAALFECRFKLLRNGETWLDVQTNAIDEFIVEPEEYASPDSLCLDLVNQCFQFLKDITHDHKHHDHKSDSIISCAPVRPSDTYTWKSLTLDAMYRKIVAVRKMESIEALSNAIGIVAYAKSFQEICKDIEIPTEQITKAIEPYSSENVEKSIRMALELAKQADTVRRWLISLVTASGLALFTIYLRFFDELNDSVVRTYLTDNSLLIMGLFTFAVIVYLRLYNFFKVADMIAATPIIKLLQFLPKPALSAILFALFTGSIAVLFWLSMNSAAPLN